MGQFFPLNTLKNACLCDFHTFFKMQLFRVFFANFAQICNVILQILKIRIKLDLWNSYTVQKCLNFP